MTSLPPGPSGFKLLTTIRWWLWPTEMMELYHSQFGDMFTLPLTGLVTTVVISDPAVIKEIFTGDPDTFHAGKGSTPLLPILGSGSLFLLDGREHRRHRKLLRPVFQGKGLDAFAETMRKTTERMIAEWPTHKTFAVLPSLQKTALEIILRTVFGANDRAHLDPLTEAIEAFVQMFGTLQGAMVLIPMFQRDFPLSPWRKFKALRSRSDAMIYAHIAHRKAQLMEGQVFHDVLSLLIQTTDPNGVPLTDVELRDELMTVLVAGHETTATSTAWVIERVLAHPEVLKRVKAELTEVLKGRPVQSSHLPSLKYLDAVIRETLRLRPIVAFISRHLVKDVTVGGVDFPAGIRLAPSVYLANRHPDYYDEPLAFKPERFLNKRPNPNAWLSFGGGDRRCIGMAFAMFEMKVILATVFQRVALELDEDGPVGFARRSITLAPKSGVRVRSAGVVQSPRPD